MVFAKNVKGSGFYAVHLKAVYLRGGGGLSAQTTQGDIGKMHKLGLSEAQLNRGNVIVDSGTTDTYFSSALSGPFNKAWKELTGTTYSHNPVSLTSEQIGLLPTIILVLTGMDGDPVGDEPIGEPDDVPNYAGNTDLSDNPRDVVIAIPAAHYMEYDPDTKKYVPRFYTQESSGSVLGANTMMGHDVFFDVARGRVGFAESNCDYASLILSEGGSISKPPKAPVQTVSTKIEVPEKVPEEQDEAGVTETHEDGGDSNPTPATENQPIDQSSSKPGADQSENNATPYELFNNDKPKQGKSEGFWEEILDDMKHECSSTSCRSVAALIILVAMVVVIVGTRRAMARRRVVRQYQEAELEISDLALDSDSDDEEGRYVDEPPMPRIT
mmetsp:Transcript_24536/g.44249  ORF Transcript_24536/g.44249 Transcript_24536/m.44249 type:complete len:384 (+) Transcript_24536:3-1154(+)